MFYISEETEKTMTKNCVRRLAGQRMGWSALCWNSTKFFWNHKFNWNPEPLRRLPGILTWKTRSTKGIVPRIILVLKWLLRSEISSPYVVILCPDSSKCPVRVNFVKVKTRWFVSRVFLHNKLLMFFRCWLCKKRYNLSRWLF